VHTIYLPKADNMPAEMRALRDQCVQQMGIKQIPTIAISSQINNRNDPEGAAFFGANFIIIKDQHAKNLASGDIFSRYVFCHEMGHIAQGQAVKHTDISRRGFITGAAGSMLLGGAVGHTAAKSIAPEPQLFKSQLLKGVGTGAGTLGGFEGFSFGVRYYNSLKTRKSEFYADRMAEKVMGDAVFEALIKHGDKEIKNKFVELEDGSIISLLNLPEFHERTKEFIPMVRERYGKIINDDLIVPLTKQIVLADFNPKSDANVRLAREEGDRYPKFFDRIIYLLEEKLEREQSKQSARG